MFDKFGEFDSFSEINELAENLLNEGDIESLKVVAKENGIQADFVDLYTHGEIPELCDKLTAALGKIDVEAAELKPKEIMEDWVEYLRGQCMENELLAHNGFVMRYIQVDEDEALILTPMDPEVIRELFDEFGKKVEKYKKKEATKKNQPQTRKRKKKKSR